MKNQYRTLVINPKTTKTIISVFHNEICIFKETAEHPSSFKSDVSEIDQEVTERKVYILKLLSDAGINMSKLDAVSANGGLLRPIEGGTYIVTKEILLDLRRSYNGKHASNLGGILAYEIAKGLNIPAYIVDPPVVDELNKLARFSGLPGIERKSIFHALNQKEVARKASRELNIAYEQANLIVSHIGNGITIGAHYRGRVIDVNNGLHGDGPFSLERAGTIPSEALIGLCFSGKYKEEDVIKIITSKGGLRAYLKTDNLTEIENRIRNNDTNAKVVIEAMAYQIAKEIGSMATVTKGKIHGIVLTGELANSEILTDFITERAKWIADVFIYPGEYDLQALNAGTLRVLRREEKPKIYIGNLLKKGESSS